MEYLMTYGWAILIIAVVLGALFSLGVFRGAGVLGTACISPSGYFCRNVSYSFASGNITATVGQSTGTNWNNWAVAFAPQGAPLTSTGVANVLFVPPSIQSLGSGQTATVTIPATGSVNAGTRLTGTLWVCYTTGSSTINEITRGNCGPSASYARIATVTASAASSATSTYVYLSGSSASTDVGVSPSKTNVINLNNGNVVLAMQSSSGSGTVTVTVANVLGATTPPPDGYTTAAAFSIGLTSGGTKPTVTTHVTLKYNCGVLPVNIAPYVLNGGTWQLIPSFSVDTSACTVTFVISVDPTVALLETNATTTTTSTTSTTSVSTSVSSTSTTSTSTTSTPALSMVGWTASNSVITYGQYQMLDAVVSGGVSPYTYNFDIYNSIFTTPANLLYNALYTGVASTSNALTYVENSAWLTGNFVANITVTDSASSPASVYNSLFYTVVTTTTSTTSTSSTSTSTSTSTTSSTTAYATNLYCTGGWTSKSYYASILSDGTQGTWTASTTYPVSSGTRICVPGDTTNPQYIYCIDDSNGHDTTTYYAAALSNNALGTWTASSLYPISTDNRGCVSWGGYAYCVGGYQSTAAVASAYYAVLSSGGVGTWTATTSYPHFIEYESCIASNGYIYCITGNNYNDTAGSTYYSDVYYAALSSSGIGTWSATNAYPFSEDTSCTSQQYSPYSSYVYCMGGGNEASGGFSSNAVYYAKINGGSGLGTWTATSDYPINSYALGCASGYSTVYCVGASSAGKMYAYANILSGGGIGTWTASNSYPVSGNPFSCVAAMVTSH